MKHLLNKFLIILMTMIFLCNSNNAFASVDLNRTMNLLAGNWYNEQDKLIFQVIGNNINGCPVVDISNFAGGGGHFVADYKLFIKDHYGIMRMELNRTGQVHYLTVNNELTLKNVKGDYYKNNHFESIGGIYLGMPLNQVIKIYGQADRQSNNTLYYDKDKWAVRIGQGHVEGIYIYPGSIKKFDRSYLNALNTVNEFALKYGAKVINLSDGLYMMNIAKNEYIWISKVAGESYVMLSKYNY